MSRNSRSNPMIPICSTCLSRDRVLLPLPTHKCLVQYFQDIKLSRSDYVCWECQAIINKMISFRDKAIKAQKTLKDMIKKKQYTINNIQSLSDLKECYEMPEGSFIIGIQLDENEVLNEVKIEEHHESETEGYHQNDEVEVEIGILQNCSADKLDPHNLELDNNKDALQSDCEDHFFDNDSVADNISDHKSETEKSSPKPRNALKSKTKNEESDDEASPPKKKSKIKDDASSDEDYVINNSSKVKKKCNNKDATKKSNNHVSVKYRLKNMSEEEMLQARERKRDSEMFKNSCYKCNKCVEIFGSKKALDCHMANHNKDTIQIINVEDLPVGEQLERPLTIKKVRKWNPNFESNVDAHSENQRSPIPHEIRPSPIHLECNVQREENQRSPILHEIPPSPAMYVECGGSANSTPSTSGYQFKTHTVDEDNNISTSSIVNRKQHIREQEKIGRSSKCVRRSLWEERPYLAVTSSVAASSSSDRNPAASLRPQPPLRDLEIEDPLHCGSEEENESEDDEFEATMLVPRALRMLWETPVDEEEEVVERAAPSSAPVDEDEQAAERAAPSFASEDEHVEVAERAAPLSAPEDEDVEVAERAAPSSAASESYLPQFFLDFEWRSFPNPPIPPETRREPFRHTYCGPTIRVTDPYDIFTSIWDREFMEFVATETNRYAQEVAEKMMHTGELRVNSRIVDWKDTTADELYIYMAIILAMGVVIKSRTEEYWNAEMDIFCTPGFRVNMSLRRFQLLNKCLHFNSTANMVGLNLSAPEAKLFKVQPVISHLNAKFSNLYIMRQNIALDESLLLWKGRLDINQFIPNKAAAVGIKSYEICESATGYLWRFQIHAPKPRTPQAAQDVDPFTASTPALVLDLIKGLEHAGYTLWMDNFYNSPALARKLKSIGFDCVGTLRTNRKFVPVELNNLTKTSMQPGQVAGFTSGDVDVMVWRDQNRVATISTYHGNAVSTVDNSTKPIVIRDYNLCMGGVDKKDQMLATYPIERKRTRIWYKKLFRRLLNVSTLNAYIIHKKNATVKLTHRNFRRTLINTILKKHAKPAVMPTPAKAGQVFYEAKYHYPATYPFLATPRSSNRQRHTCRVCHKRTTTFCAGCNKAVCAFTCFSDLHP